MFSYFSDLYKKRKEKKRLMLEIEKKTAIIDEYLKSRETLVKNGKEDSPTMADINAHIGELYKELSELRIQLHRL